jgi:hypothetical protein
MWRSAKPAGSWRQRRNGARNGGGSVVAIAEMAARRNKAIRECAMASAAIGNKMAKRK